MKMLAPLLLKPLDFVMWLAQLVLFCIAGIFICSVIVVLFYGSLLGAISLKDRVEDA